MLAQHAIEAGINAVSDYLNMKNHIFSFQNCIM